jgi:hypothetical protein
MRNVSSWSIHLGCVSLATLLGLGVVAPAQPRVGDERSRSGEIPDIDYSPASDVTVLDASGPVYTFTWMASDDPQSPDPGKVVDSS